MFESPRTSLSTLQLSFQGPQLLPLVGCFRCRQRAALHRIEGSFLTRPIHFRCGEIVIQVQQPGGKYVGLFLRIDHIEIFFEVRQCAADRSILAFSSSSCFSM